MHNRILLWYFGVTLRSRTEGASTLCMYCGEQRANKVAFVDSIALADITCIAAATILARLAVRNSAGERGPR